MRMVYLPLDSRPCNLRFPVQLAAFAGHTCLTPGLDAMDHFRTPASFSRQKDYLFLQGQAADAFVISADQLCYGSLLASRESDVEMEEALKRLETIRELHGRFPKTPIYLVSTIMRASISALSRTDLPAYEAVSQWSELCDRAEGEDNDRLRQAAKEAEKRIPGPVLTRYRAVRERNHRVNCECVELVRQGMADSLLLLVEDSAPYGFPRMEQRKLMALSKDLDRVTVSNGTDEGGCLAVMKAVRAWAAPPRPLSVDVRYPLREDGKFIALYESQPFEDNLRQDLRYLGFQEAEDAEIVLVVCAPPDGRQGEGRDTVGEETIREMGRQVKALMDTGRKVYLLDLLRANGGSPPLMRELGSDLERLWGYSAWNTACNALGTLLSQIASDAQAGKKNEAFLCERLLDDLIYESVVRPQLNAALSAEGEDVLSLRDRARAEELLRALFAGCGEPAMALIRSRGDFTVSLPWERTFEVEALACCAQTLS